MKIIIDVMGSDLGPDTAVEAIIKTIDKVKSDIVVFGDEQKINTCIKKHLDESKYNSIKDRINVINATEVITNDDSAAMSIKSKKDSSMVKSLIYLKEQTEDSCMISAGNTGALMTGALLFLGRIKGVERPALSPILPTYDNKGFLLVDSGANVNAKEEQLVQFANMRKCIYEVYK